MTRDDHSYSGALKGLCLIACDLGTSIMWPSTSELGCRATGQASGSSSSSSSSGSGGGGSSSSNITVNNTAVLVVHTYLAGDKACV
jgi:uncharacterized spore protein YtfJ